MEVYIVFTDTKTSLGRMIKTYTQYPYSHVSLSFDRELNELYSFGRKNVNNAFIGGFVKEDIKNHLFQRAHCAVFSCSVGEAEYGAMRDFVKKMEQGHEQYKYNLSGLFGVMMKKNFEREYAFFCSQFVTEVLQRGGIKVSDKPANMVMPRDIFNVKELDFVYSGSLKSYPFSRQADSGLEQERQLIEAL